MLHAPRYLAYGKLHGTVAEVADKDAASVEITPAFVDIRRIGHGHETSTDSKGRTTTTDRYVSPIVSAAGERDLAQAEREPIVLFLCDSDEDNLREAAARSGPVSGRMHPVVTSAERRAIEKVPNLVRGAGTLQCVVPGGGWAVIWVLLRGAPRNYAHRKNVALGDILASTSRDETAQRPELVRVLPDQPAARVVVVERVTQVTLTALKLGGQLRAICDEGVVLFDQPPALLVCELELAPVVVLAQRISPRSSGSTSRSGGSAPRSSRRAPRSSGSTGRFCTRVG